MLPERNEDVMDQDNIRPAAGLEAQRGFTLIELSIVLVIIGLIIGGVLKGQEMIESARLKTTVAQVDGYRAAINTFVDRYQVLPGDMPVAVATAEVDAAIGTGGNGDGVIGAAGVAWNANTSGNAEANAFWSHLAAAELVSGVQTNGAAVLGQGLPAARIAGAGFTLANTAQGGNWLRLHNGVNAAAGAAPALSGEQSLEIDRKFDDALPASGTIFTLSAAPCVNGAGGYNGVSAASACMLSFQLTAN